MGPVIGPETLVMALGIGVVAGVVGGLAGIGGSIIMLPALAILVGDDAQRDTQQHLFQASAMLVNVVVAWSSSRRHQEAGVHDPGLRRSLLPGLVAGIVIGVLISEQLRGRWLQVGLVTFLWLYCLYNVFTVAWAGVRRKPASADAAETTPPSWRIAAIGSVTGVPSGILGIGGGIVMVPLMQMWGGVGIRRAIAASASVMWISAGIGALLKMYGLSSHGESWLDALAIAGPMALGAFAGSRAGAGLTHKLKLPHLKLVISGVLAVAGLRLVGVI